MTLFEMNKSDKEILIGLLRMKAGFAVLIFIGFALLISLVTLLFITVGNPSPGIINRAGLGIGVAFFTVVVIFRKAFLIIADLSFGKKIRIKYDGFNKITDKPAFIEKEFLLTAISSLGELYKIDFEHSFTIELSKFSKDILHITQFNKIIFPNDPFDPTTE